MDERTWSVMTTIQQFMDEALEAVRAQGQGTAGPKLTTTLQHHLGRSAAELPVVRLDIPPHQFVNLDVAMAALVEQHGGGEVIGIGGGDQRHHQTMGDLLAERGQWSTPVGPVDRTRLETGPDSSREAVAMGIHLFRYDGVPVAAYQRRIQPQFGGTTSLEVVATEPVSEALLADVRQLMVERSVYRGQVLSFGLTDAMYGPSAGGIAFLPRPEVGAGDVVLPDGALARLERHVAGTARHRETLRAAGQHLKRGLLLYGPPGTGKTHTVRYLLGRLPGVTSVVLAGNALGLVAEATQLAQALQPAIVVMEDVDLIAEHRELHLGPQPLLFTLLDAMDGLSSDADVAFVLTTNRADLLESALSQRPGRIDLAAEIPLPDAAARRRLLELYARGLPVSSQALDAAAQRSEGVTASFFKELTRRTVLLAAEADQPVDDARLAAALDEMLADGERLTRVLLGSAPAADGPEPPGPHGGWTMVSG
ncbi:MAG: ATP-binding protein [Kineosporiaceae bacterium]